MYKETYSKIIKGNFEVPGWCCRFTEALVVGYIRIFYLWLLLVNESIKINAMCCDSKWQGTFKYVYWYVQLECTHIQISLIVFESGDKEHQPAFDSPSRANLTIALNVECEKNDNTGLVFYSGSFYFIITIIISLPKISILERKRKSI